MPRTLVRSSFAVVTLFSLAGCALARPRPAAAPAQAGDLEAAGISRSLPAQLDSIMAAAIADAATPGAAIAIGHHGRVVYTNGWGQDGLGGERAAGQ